MAAEVQKNVGGLLQHGSARYRGESASRLDGMFGPVFMVRAGGCPSAPSCVFSVSSDCSRCVSAVPAWFAVLSQRTFLLMVVVEENEGGEWCPGAH